MNNTEKMLVDEIEKNKKLETELVSIKEKLTKECIRFSRVCEDLSDILSGGGNPKKYIIYTEYLITLSVYFPIHLARFSY